jgi:hypothetical protein
VTICGYAWCGRLVGRIVRDVLLSPRSPYGTEWCDLLDELEAGREVMRQAVRDSLEATATSPLTRPPAQLNDALVQLVRDVQDAGLEVPVRRMVKSSIPTISTSGLVSLVGLWERRPT